ncbi:MAG: putative aminohydrolase SsnA [Deltaproteobacteria bacterium]|nr:putative aminohydrolase SsnA [Deltaproteobacteria bacterium]
MANTDQKLVGNGWVVTLGEDNRVIEKGGVLIEGTTVKEIGATEDLKARYPEARFIDAKGRTILPGFICAHHHLYSTFACGISCKPSENFVQILENLWWKLDRALTLEDVELSALIPIARAIRAGTTTLLDHHASPSAILGSLGGIGDVVKKTGIRASLCYEITDRNGEQGADEGLKESREWLKRVKRDKSGRLHGLVGLHAAMTVGEKTLARSIELAKEFDTGLHVHVAEDKADEDDSVQKYGKRVVERLHAAGGLGPKSMAIHCIHVDDREIDLLRETNTIVVHNPQSNMNNAVGAARILDMIGRGIRVGLGTDGMTSDMREEVRAALWLRHHEHKDSRVGFVEAALALLKTNAEIASAFFGKPLGRIAVGAPADLIVSDHIPFTPLTPDNVLGHVIFGVAAEPINTTIVDGKILMHDKKLKTLDWEEVSERAAKLSPETWKRFAAL